MSESEDVSDFQESSSLTTDRINTLHNVAGCLNHVGTHLAAEPGAWQRGIGLVTQFAAELIAGATVCATERALYASAALHRQLIEVMHLLRYFELDTTCVQRWVEGGDTSYEFRPASLRKAIGGTSAEYSNHCELAGHPRRAGWIFLPGQRYFEGELLIVRSRISGQIVKAHMQDIVLSDGLRHAHDSFRAVAAAATANREKIDDLTYAALAYQQMEIEAWASNDPLAAISRAELTDPTASD